MEPEAVSLSQVNTIIPLLLVSDPHLPVLFHSTFLAKEFLQALTHTDRDLVPSIKVNEHEIVGLCLMSMDEFESFENRVLSRDLGQLLLEYCERNPYREISAGTYLSNIKSDPFPPQPGIVAESEKVLDESCIRLFGKSCL